MKIVSSSDWRETLPFETPVRAADVVEGEPTRCFACGPASEPRERDDLWAFKHRHPKNHDGYVRFYCSAHVPAAPAPPAPPRGERRPAPRRLMPTVPDKPAVLCPNCFVEVPATGVCGMCGTRVA